MGLFVTAPTSIGPQVTDEIVLDGKRPTAREVDFVYAESLDH